MDEVVTDQEGEKEQEENDPMQKLKLLPPASESTDPKHSKHKNRQE
jgi:hypothetical protein